MADQATVSVEVQLTPTDIYRLSLITLFQRFRWFLAIAVLGILLVIFANVKAGQWDWNWQNLLGPFFLLVFIPYGFFIAPYFAARKYLRKNPNVAGPLSYTFSDRGIEVLGPHSQGRLDWEAILRAQETRSLFLLYPQTAIAHVIPKRFLANTDQQTSLRALVRAHVKNAKLLG
jgi:hypothetical protein